MIGTYLKIGMTCMAMALSATAFAQSKESKEKATGASDRPVLELQKASDVQKMNIHTTDNKIAGNIANLAIEPETGRVVFVIVKPPAEANSKDEYKIVPFEAIDFSSEKGETVKMNVNASRFKDAPPFDPAGWGKPGAGDGKWSEIVYRHYGVTPRPSLDAKSKLKTDSPPLVKATDLLKMEIENTQAEKFGEIDDLAMDMKHGAIVYALMVTTLKADGPEKFIAVPWTELKVTQADPVLVLDLDRDRLSEAPRFMSFQSISSPAYIDKVIAFYGTEPELIYGYVPEQGTPVASLDSGGWDHRGAYGKLFRAGNIETVTGKVEAIERVTPMKGMSDGVRLQLGADSNRNTSIQLGPVWFIERQTLPFKVGDEVSVVGSRTEIDGRPVFMAIEVRRGDDILYLRDQQGTPRWDATYRMKEVARPAGTPSRSQD